jgi:PIN domain nuclease of toxin-antitoxin system
VTRVLDASALLAFLHDEPGAEQVRRAFDDALVSTVNWAEVIQKSLRREADVGGMRAEFAEVGVIFEPFTAAQAETAARLWESTRQHGLSLVDRACLALAIEKQAVVLTADRAWTDLGLAIEIQALR